MLEMLRMTMIREEKKECGEIRLMCFFLLVVVVSSSFCFLYLFADAIDDRVRVRLI